MRSTSRLLRGAVRVAALLALLAGLVSLERSALVLTAVEGHTYEEAAVLLGTTAGALRAAASRTPPKARC